MDRKAEAVFYVQLPKYRNVTDGMWWYSGIYRSENI